MPQRRIYAISGVDNAEVSPSKEGFNFDVETAQGETFTFNLATLEAGRLSWVIAKAAQAAARQTGLRPENVRVQPLEPQAINVSQGRKPGELLVYFDLTAFQSCFALSADDARRLATLLHANAEASEQEPPRSQ